jgi:hypothetical protein
MAVAEILVLGFLWFTAVKVGTATYVYARYGRALQTMPDTSRGLHSLMSELHLRSFATHSSVRMGHAGDKNSSS